MLSCLLWRHTVSLLCKLLNYPENHYIPFGFLGAGAGAYQRYGVGVGRFVVKLKPRSPIPPPRLAVGLALNKTERSLVSFIYARPQLALFSGGAPYLGNGMPTSTKSMFLAVCDLTPKARFFFLPKF